MSLYALAQPDSFPSSEPRAPEDSRPSGVQPAGAWQRLQLQAAQERAASRAHPLSVEVFELVYRQMFSLAAGRTSDLDDLVQDATEQALRSLPSFEGRSKLSTWTFQICYRTWLKRRRSLGRWFRRFTYTPEGELPESPAETPMPTADMESAERILKLREAISELSPKRRAVVILHDLEGIGCEEIASIVDAKLGTVRSRLRDGRKDLAENLRRDGYFEAESAGGGT